MAGKVQAKRDALRAKLIQAAQDQIAQGGLSAIKARDLAREAECSVGAIYNLFDDLSDLILEVNGITFGQMGAEIRAATAIHQDHPDKALVAMGRAYHAYATSNRRPWRALFEVEMSSESKIPTWYMRELAQLFAIIGNPMKQIWPQKSESEIDVAVRTLFSAIHGVVLLASENRISAVPPEHIQTAIEHLVLSYIEKN